MAANRSAGHITEFVNIGRNVNRTGGYGPVPIGKVMDSSDDMWKCHRGAYGIRFQQATFADPVAR